MKSLTLVDTSSWIEALRKDGDRNVRERVASLLVGGSACVNRMILLELWNGARGEAEKRRLSELEAALPVLDIVDDVWKQAVRIAVDCRSNGLSAPATDIVIFACARFHGVSLEHRDAHITKLETLFT